MERRDPSLVGKLVRRHRIAAALSQEALAERAGLSVRAIGDLERGIHQVPRLEVEESLYRLGASRLLVLAPGTANVWVVSPFCAVPTDFRVYARGRTYWSICIRDALGIPAALHADVTITARCGDCGDELALEVRAGRLSHGEEIVHFAVPAIRWWDNIAFA